ncbi:MAG: dockerin type I repeat-containing protein, partial [Ruminococcus sp.]|nr:dockerin type I repeat-containing protein [Ruminococcus sp.]
KFILEPSSEIVNQVIGDVNADGEFSVADLVMMQKFILGDSDLTDWKAGDLTEDGIINVLDLVKMKELLIKG